MRKGIFIALVMVTLVCCGCVTKQESAPGIIKIGLMPDEATLPYYVAVQDGIFSSYGLDVEPVAFQSAMERDSALTTGKIVAAENDPVGVILLRNAGYDIRIVSLELQETPDKIRFAILASPRSNITSVSDLAGKKIAISSNTIIEYITDALIGDTPVEKVEVRKVPLRMQMLLNGDVDAATLPEPLVSYAISRGAKLVISDSMLENRTVSQTVIVFRGDFIDANPELVHKFLEAYGEAVRRINANPEKYRELLVEKTHMPSQIASNYKIATYMQPQQYPRSDFESVNKWLEKKNLIQKPVSYEDAVWIW